MSPPVRNDRSAPPYLNPSGRRRHESELARWALHRLTQTVEAAPSDTPPERRASLHALLVIALDCTPRDFTAMVDPTGEVKQPAPPSAERRTRQQKRAEARARAKELAVA